MTVDSHWTYLLCAFDVLICHTVSSTSFSEYKVVSFMTTCVSAKGCFIYHYLDGEEKEEVKGMQPCLQQTYAAIMTKEMMSRVMENLWNRLQGRDSEHVVKEGEGGTETFDGKRLR